MKSSTPAVCGYVLLPSFSRLIHLTIQEDGIKRQSWFFLWENYHKKLFLKSEKTFLRIQSCKSSCSITTTYYNYNWELAPNSDGYCMCTTRQQCCVTYEFISADVYHRLVNQLVQYWQKRGILRGRECPSQLETKVKPN